MFPLTLDRTRPLKVLCLGAHCDDIEIGCGGTLLRLAAQQPDMEMRWEVFTGSALRHGETRRAADHLLDGIARSRLELHSLPESYLPQHWGAVKERFERIKAEYQPSLIFTHRREDAHQDHRVVSELTWNTFRDHLILEYEIPKYEGDMGNPNLFIALSPSQADRKVEVITECFDSQHGRSWFDARTFFGLLRLRGIGCNASSGYAEAFHSRKITL